MHYVARAAETRRGARIAAMTFPWPVFGTMLQGLECCWLGQFGQYTERPPCEALVGYMNRVRDNGFDWALAECLAVVGQPELRMEEGRPRPAAVYRKEAAAIHARLGTRSLTSLLAPMAQWEYPLKALEELAFEARNKPGAAKKRGPTPPPAPAGVGDSRRRRRGRGQAARAASVQERHVVRRQAGLDEAARHVGRDDGVPAGPGPSRRGEDRAGA